MPFFCPGDKFKDNFESDSHKNSPRPTPTTTTTDLATTLLSLSARSLPPPLLGSKGQRSSRDSARRYNEDIDNCKKKKEGNRSFTWFHVKKGKQWRVHKLYFWA